MKEIEYELKVLDIDTDKLKDKLTQVWAEYLWTLHYKRYVYDFEPVNINKWIRLRTDGVKSFLTIKEIKSETIEGTYETEIEVSDFGTTHMMLKELWYNAKSYQENKRESYSCRWVQLEIDSWPKISPYLEIEWKDKSSVLSMLKELWFSQEDATCKNTKQIYQSYGINLWEINQLKF